MNKEFAVQVVIVLVLTFSAAYIVIRLIHYFFLATGSFWERLFATAKRSATIFLQMIVLLWSWILSGVGMASDIVNLPQVQDFMRILLKPVYIAGIIACIATLTILARMRTLPDVPITAATIPPPDAIPREDQP
jgi:hypothetical protein